MKKLTLNDPEMQSPDLLAQNVERMKSLFPEAFTEGKIDFEVLKELLGDYLDLREERYGLHWNGKRDARRLAITPSMGTLRPCPEESVDWENTQNLIIEGDNLEVLKLLQRSYIGKVRLIYIDPPYNTGQDFVYRDDYQDNIQNYLKLTSQVDDEGRRLSSNTETSGRFHTDWLNMMYPRLRLARDLLRKDGVLVISIDDSEIDNLNNICKEIFGEENFVACMIWEKGRKNDAKLVSVGHEYLLIFAKSQAHLRETKTIWREEKPGASDIWAQYQELRARYGSDDSAIEVDLQKWFASLDKKHPAKKWSRYKRVDGNGPWRDSDMSWPGGGGPRYDVIHPKTGLPCKVPERGWRYAKSEEMQRQIKLGTVVFRDDHTEPPFRKAHIRPIPDEIEEILPLELEGDEESAIGSELEESEEEFATQVRGSYFYKQSQVSVKFLRQLFGANVFNNPKDHMELGKLFDYVTANDKEAIVLDFFAGSGSTAHAVMDLNVSDAGNRRYILVQLPEPLNPTDKDQKIAAHFCDKLGKPPTIVELTKERMRRAAKKLNDADAGKLDFGETKPDRGFRVFKLDASNLRPWDPAPENLKELLLDHVDNILPGRSEQDLLYELLLKTVDLALTVPIEEKRIAGKQVYSVGYGALMACLTKSISPAEVEPLAMGMVAWRSELAPLGSTNFYFRDSAFAGDVAKSNMVAILTQNLPPHALAKNGIRSL